jgi:N-methylhydantoinase B
VRWNGGGGIGDPLERPAEKVLADINAGVISERAASDVYGVVRKAAALDESATRTMRSALRRVRLAAEPPQ